MSCENPSSDTDALMPHGPRRTALRPTGNLLVAFSGGLGSAVLLDLVNRCYVSPDESLVTTEGGRDHPRHERVWKKVTVCYVELCSAFPEMKDRTDDIRRTVASCPGVEFLPLRLEDAFDPLWWKMNGFPSDLYPLKVTLGNDALPYDFTSSQSSTETPAIALRRYLASLPTPTALDATVKTLTRVLLQYTAVATGSSHLVLGTTLTSLAVHLISSVSHGGGFHIKEETQEEWYSVPPSASDAGSHRPSTPHSVRMIRPLRDVGRKECAAWSWWMHLTIVGREEWRWSGTKPGVGRLTKGDSTSAETTEHLSRYLCYACHTNLTSKNARPLPSLYADIGNFQEATPPVWISGRIASLRGTTASHGAVDGPSAPKPMSKEAMLDKIKGFLLDD
ncbi:hypothetical protein EIP86_011026 [Pleurotus ostreatoroseus]|nr:hypothetical protein EIP86_011026 [Pleurotus ostreatoroseus]